jgi:hypothetical protein
MDEGLQSPPKNVSNISVSFSSFQYLAPLSIRSIIILGDLTNNLHFGNNRDYVIPFYWLKICRYRMHCVEWAWIMRRILRQEDLCNQCKMRTGGESGSWCFIDLWRIRPEPFHTGQLFLC